MSLSILSKSGDDKVQVVGLDKGDLGLWGERLVELDERGEPGLKNSSDSASVISSG